jgi:hypothetical protein
MKQPCQNRVVGLLGVGFDHTDGHVRITQSKNSQVIMGSEESHKALQKICVKIEQTVQDSGRKISDYTPDEFMKLIGTLY